MYQEKPKDVEEIDSPVLVSSQTVCGYEIVGQFLGVLVAWFSVLPFVAAPLPARRPARLLSVLSETFLPDPRPQLPWRRGRPRFAVFQCAIEKNKLLARLF